MKLAVPKAGPKVPAAPDAAAAAVKAAVAGTAVELCAPKAGAEAGPSRIGVEAAAAKDGAGKLELVNADAVKGPDAGISGEVAPGKEPNGTVADEPYAGAEPAVAGQLNAGVPAAPPPLEALPVPSAAFPPALCPAAQPASVAPAPAVADVALELMPVLSSAPSPTAKLNGALLLLEPKGCPAAAKGCEKPKGCERGLAPCWVDPEKLLLAPNKLLLLAWLLAAAAAAAAAAPPPKTLPAAGPLDVAETEPASGPQSTPKQEEGHRAGSGGEELCEHHKAC